MRIFTAGVVTETSTFAPWPTGERGSREGGVWHGDASASGETPQNLVARLYRDLAAGDGHDFTESLFAVATPARPSEGLRAIRPIKSWPISAGRAFDRCRAMCCGAMVATECDDCEADTIAARVRES